MMKLQESSLSNTSSSHQISLPSPSTTAPYQTSTKLNQSYNKPINNSNKNEI